jgi:hypothetical protein
MANLTITVDRQTLSRARIRALEDGTSVNAILRDYLERYAGGGEGSAALAEFARLATASEASSGPGGRSWTRDEIHERTGLR